ncbi:THAP domain-containing protein 5-like isoform X1 [Brienomyrus brachyistius]|uniref:THAP domain-containing protein 5-like isoform X1 n=2 Tax=Brienomyrus brachyistius TaxID=42636 RepID=UPI0020B2402B|nr:THAP domain-containing protein 5-like isoform X1 [Brienomyrus brachyistius]
MPKYCTAPNCRNDAGSTGSDRKSFYKFPLHDPARLQQWLKNMGREGWTPSRHQHICHEHFTPSCFTMRWGIRYLASGAVPTIFQLSENAEKRKSTSNADRKAKRIRPSSRKAVLTVPLEKISNCDSVHQDASVGSVQLYTITVEPSLLLESSTMEQSMGSAPTALALPAVDGQDSLGDDFPMTLFQAVEDFSVSGGGERAEVMVVSKGASTDSEDTVEGLATALLAEGQEVVIHDAVGQGAVGPSSLVIENMALETVEPPAGQDDRGIQIIAYFETIPSVLPAGATHCGLTPDTVLSSALSPQPIVSTLPIVSKHMPPLSGSFVLASERPESSETEVEGQREGKEEDGIEHQRKQLDEHRYHKNSLSKEQLEVIVTELQKKVKVLQQRHRRHLDKLLGLESTVSQLRHSKLLSEERLSLLERAYVQTSAVVSDAGETVAIICEDEKMAYLYSLPEYGTGEGLEQDMEGPAALSES